MRGFLIAIGVAGLVWLAGGVVLCGAAYHYLHHRPHAVIVPIALLHA